MTRPFASIPDVAVPGAVLVVATAGWMWLTGVVADASAWPVVGLIVGTACVVAVGWVVGSRRPILVPAAVVVLGLVLILLNTSDTFRTGPLQGPLGYSNASAALLGQACIAAVLLWVVWPNRSARMAGAAAIAVFATAIWFARTWLVLLLLPTLVVATLGVMRRWGARPAVAVSGAIFAVVLVGTLLIGSTRLGEGEGILSRAISGVRITLWHEALTIAADRPLFGVGPGRFSTTSPMASADPDLRWAHNEFLQAGAESGFPGYALVVALFGWGFVALWRTASGAASALGGAALGLLGAHASFDYVLHFPAVALTGGAILGTALGIGFRSAPTRTAIPVARPVEELV